MAGLNSYLYLLYRPLNYSSIPKVEYNLNFLNTSDQVLVTGQQRLDVFLRGKNQIYCLENIQNPQICKDANEYNTFLTTTLTEAKLSPDESLFTLILNPDRNVTSLVFDPINILQQSVKSLIDSSRLLIKLNSSSVTIDKQSCLSKIPNNITYSLDSSSIKDAIGCTLSYESNIIPNTTDQIWFWDSNEPQEGGIGCVVIQKSGKWKSFACGEPTYFACQSTTDPLKWQLSEKLASFQNIVWDKSIDCPEGFQFGVPRLPVINTQLTKVLNDANTDNVLINLSDVWVSLCYQEDADECPYTKSDKQARLVTVSIAGGLVMLIITFLCVYLNYRRYTKYMLSERRRQDVSEKLRLIQLNTIPK